MSLSYNHTYWDGMTVQRHTSRCSRRPWPQQEHPYRYGHPDFIGPPTALAKAVVDFARFYSYSR